METTGKVLGNVGTLDLRNATEESVATIDRIGNVGQILYSPETARLIPMLNCGNIGGSLEVPEGAQLTSGQTFLKLKDISEPISMVSSGQLIIEADTTAEDVEQGLNMLVVSGQILCPEHLTGVVSSKIRELSGQLLPYTAEMLIRTGQVQIDDHFLNGLDDGAQLLVAGKIDLPKIVDDALLTRKLGKLLVYGKITCREENMAALNSVLDQRYSSFKISSIPAGFEPVNGALRLSDDTLPSLPGRKLYCTGTVEIAADLGADALNGALDEIIPTRLLVCPAALKEITVKKCDMLQTKAVFYEGELWHIDDETTLRASRFDYLEGQATLLVREDLHIDADIEPKVLADRLHKVHNLGEIYCTPAQMGALEARMGLNEGELLDSTQERDEKEEGIGNVGHLAL